jgi:hypothetical protein
MKPSDKCRVDDCDRRAAASMIRDTLPGPLPLCAIHTEDFRMNSATWMVTWAQTSAEPTSVKAAPAVAVGRSTLGPAGVPASESSPGTSLRRRLVMWRGTRS